VIRGFDASVTEAIEREIISMIENADKSDPVRYLRVLARNGDLARFIEQASTNLWLRSMPEAWRPEQPQAWPRRDE
jgi:hypothetical protein